MGKRLIYLICALLLSASLPVLVAHADLTENIMGPQLGMSGGVEGATGGQIGALVRVCFDLLRVGGHSSETNICENPVVGLLRTRVAMSTTVENGTVTVPYLDIDFQMSNFPRNIYDTRIIPIVDPSIRVRRDVRINQDFVLRLSVFTLQLFLPSSNLNGPIRANLTHPTYRSEVAAFLRLSADAVGLKVVSHLNSRGDFTGVNIAQVLAEGGLSFPVAGSVRAQVLLGASSDINIGGIAGIAGGFSLQSDVQTYAQVAFDVSNVIRLFIRGGWNGAWESLDGDTRGSLQGMAGATFLLN